MKVVILALAVSALLHDPLRAQAPSDSGAFAARDTLPLPTLSVESAVAGVRVFVDTALVGATPLKEVALTPGLHVLRFVQPDDKRWAQSVVIDTVSVHPGDRMRETVVFPSAVSLASEPYGAMVMLGDSTLGTTPVRLTGLPGRGTLTLSKPGFDTSVVTLPVAGSDLHVRLESSGMPSPPGQSPYLAVPRSETPVPLYLTAGVAVLGGVSAAYFKIRADNNYENYLQTGNSGDLDQVHRLDLLAGISLAASQAGILALTYLLLSR